MPHLGLCASALAVSLNRLESGLQPPATDALVAGAVAAYLAASVGGLVVLGAHARRQNALPTTRSDPAGGRGGNVEAAGETGAGAAVVQPAERRRHCCGRRRRHAVGRGGTDEETGVLSEADEVCLPPGRPV